MSPSNIGQFNKKWQAPAAVKNGAKSAVAAQLVMANGVNINGSIHNVLYFGTLNGDFIAMDAANGNILWSHSYGFGSPSGTYCNSHLGATQGILDTAVIDRTTQRVYVGDSQLRVHAFDLATGAEQPGWPVNIQTLGIMPTGWYSHITGGLTYNPANGNMYVPLSAECEGPSDSPWLGGVVILNARQAQYIGTWYSVVYNPSTHPYAGGGVWGFGGVSIDSVTNDFFVATGNAGLISDPFNQTPQISNTAVQVNLSQSVVRVSANGLVNKGGAVFPFDPNKDSDFGATPMLFQAPGCPQETTVVNKSGYLDLYTTQNINAGATQLILLGSNPPSPTIGFNGNYIGTQSYDPQTATVFATNPLDLSAPHGIIAYSARSCALVQLWQKSNGPASSGNDTPFSAPTIANGVVLYGYGHDISQSFANNGGILAYNDSTGALLWQTPTTGINAIQNPIVAPPIIVNGQIFAADFGGNVYQFTLNGT